MEINFILNAGNFRRAFSNAGADWLLRQNRFQFERNFRSRVSRNYRKRRRYRGKQYDVS